MKIFIAVLCISLVVSQNVILVQSGVSTTTIINPLYQTVANNNYRTTNNANYLGNGAQWIWHNNNSDSVPNGQVITFQALFTSDCPSAAATINITADNNFTAYVNGVVVGSGNNWQKIYSFPIKVVCGENNLTVVATNLVNKTPAALVFSINQIQNSCYKGCAPNGYYNRDTCNCSCITQCPCSTSLAQWINYPTCGCACKKPLTCPTGQYFNQQTCLCQCKKITCLSGYTQDINSCACVPIKLCAQLIRCSSQRIVDLDTCSCVCNTQIVCPPQTYFVEPLCQCVTIIPL